MISPDSREAVRELSPELQQSMENDSDAMQSCQVSGVEHVSRGPKDHMNIRILQTMISTMISGIPFIAGLGTRKQDPYVYVVFWALKVNPNWIRQT